MELIYPGKQSAKEILPDTQGGRDRAERVAFTAAYLRYQFGQRAEATRRNHESIVATASGRPTGTQHFADHRVVLCEERHRKAQRHHRRL